MSTPLADLAAGLEICARAVAAMAAQPSQPGRTVPSMQMLTPDEACALVAGRDERGRPRISERTLSRRTEGKDFRRRVGRKVSYERSGLEVWLRNR